MLSPTMSLPWSTMPMSDRGRLRSSLRARLRRVRREVAGCTSRHARRREQPAERLDGADGDVAHRLERLGHGLEHADVADAGAGRRRRGSPGRRATFGVAVERRPASPLRSTVSSIWLAAVRFDRGLELVPVVDPAAVDRRRSGRRPGGRRRAAALSRVDRGRRSCSGRRRLAAGRRSPRRTAGTR